MKKFFFFRSSSNTGNNNAGSPQLADNQAHWEVPMDDSGKNNRVVDKCENSIIGSPGGLFSKSRKQACDGQSPSICSGLRRSRSYSSAAFFVDEKVNTDTRPEHSARRRDITPEWQDRAKRSQDASFQLANAHERSHSSGSSKSHYDSSGVSTCSNASTKVLDRYIDEEHQPERSQSKRNSLKNLRLPPRAQYTAPTSPSESASNKSRSQSFRETKIGRFQYSSGDWVETDFGHQSPCRLAENVIEKLSQTHARPKSISREFGPDVPITIEDIYGGSVDRCYDVSVDIPSQTSCPLQCSDETINDHNRDTFSCFQKLDFFRGSVEDMKSYQNDETEDLELHRKSKEAEERVLHLSQQIEQENFLQCNGFDVPSLIKTIRKLAEDKMSLAIEVSGLLKARIAEKGSTKENLRLVKEELDFRAKGLEKEKNELQLALEKELDRRSSDWSMKLEKYRLEEQRLRERVRELAEQNVSLQRETSSCSEREMESRDMIRLLRSRSEELSEENKKVKEELCELREKFEAAEEQLDCITRNFEEKNKECKEQQRSISRMLRTCSEQEKTIEGLQERLLEEGEKQQSDKLDRQIMKLRSEQLRLSGLELTLRREIESYILEVDSLRHENIHLLERLKANGEEVGMLTFRLDKEMWSRVCCLQNQGLALLGVSVEVSSTLLQLVKEKPGRYSECKDDAVLGNGLDGLLVGEYEMKVQGIRRKTENLARSLQTASSLLQEKSDIVASRSVSPCVSDSPGILNHKISEENLKSELKAETLLTSLFKEKLYSKEMEVEQLQAEVAVIARSNDVLRCEVQNVRDNISCYSHKLKDSELQIQRKNENIYRLQSELQDSSKELAIVKGIVSKVTEERDQMWEKVKQFNEENMLLNSEMNILKKKMEALEEDVLLKEGQITILKDTINNGPFDLLASEIAKEFLLN